MVLLLKGSNEWFKFNFLLGRLIVFFYVLDNMALNMKANITNTAIDVWGLFTPTGFFNLTNTTSLSASFLQLTKP